MYQFSGGKEDTENIGEIVLESLLTSTIDSITDLNLGDNSAWFKQPANGDLLAELLSKQAGLQKINLERNYFSSNATLSILTMIAAHPSTASSLQSLNLHYAAYFDADETAEKLADIL